MTFNPKCGIMKLADSQYDTFDIPIIKIYINDSFNCRDVFTHETVQDLSEQIKKDGLLFPIVVRPADEVEEMPQGFDFSLVCGFRRITACKHFLHWETIPANVRVGLTERQAKLINLSENLERKDLNVLEEAKAIDNLFGPHRTFTSISKELNRPLKWVKVRRELLTLSEFVQKAVASQRLSARDLQEIVHAHDPDQVAKNLLKAEGTRHKYRILYHGKHKRSKKDVKELMAKLLSEGFNPNLLQLLGWAIGEIDDNQLEETISWMRDKRIWLK